MIRINGKSWKTTTTGIVMIVGGLFGIYTAIKNKEVNEATLTASITAILGGVGLLFAKDGDVTTEPYTSEVKKVEPPKPEQPK